VPQEADEVQGRGAGWTCGAQSWTLAGAARTGTEPLIGGAVKRLLLAASLGALGATGLAARASSAPEQTAPKAEAPPPAGETPEQRWQRLQAETARILAEQQADRQRYEQGVRDAEAARLRYEADMARYQRDQVRYRQEVARTEAARADYERRMAERQAEIDRRNARRAGSNEHRQADAAAAPTQCEAQQRRNRGRGRAIGGILGGVAGIAGSRVRGVGALAVLAVPAGALLGDTIARLLDCREQQQAATATEEAVRGGVGTTAAWRSETRPDVTGSSTVTAAAAPLADGNPCMTVTDIVIIDGQETRAPKRMCRRPPTNRYMRV
jgi:surface antigen